MCSAGRVDDDDRPVLYRIRQGRPNVKRLFKILWKRWIPSTQRQGQRSKYQVECDEAAAKRHRRYAPPAAHLHSLLLDKHEMQHLGKESESSDAWQSE